MLGATRDATVVIAGEPDAFAVTLSVGAWGKKLVITGSKDLVVVAVTGLPRIAIGGVTAAGSYVAARRFEGSFWNKVKGEINKLSK